MQQVDRNILIVSILIISFFNAFVGAAVNIALPKIAEEFSLHAIQLSWVSMSYLLSTVIFLVPFGNLADIYGKKKIFLFGNIVFTISSLFCAFSVSGDMLIIMRFIQGIGAAMIQSTAMAIVSTVFSLGKRAKMIGYTVSAVYLGLTMAPFLGGILVHYINWKSIFYINVVAGLFVIVSLIFKVRTEWKDAPNDKFDIKGSVVYMSAIFLLMYGFSKLPSTTGILVLLAGILFFTAFIIIEKRVTTPVFNIKLFTTNRLFAFSNFAALINYAATFAITFILSLFLQYAHGLSAKDAGLLLIIQPGVMTILASISGKLAAKYNPAVLSSIGMAIIVIGLLMLCFISIDVSHLYLVVCLIILGFGFGLFSSPNTSVIMGSVEKKYLGIASATVSTMRLAGMMMSMAIAAMIINVFIGETKISASNINNFIVSSRVIFIIFACLCFVGVFASLARNKNKIIS